MKVTTQTLRNLYLKDLELPDRFHGRDTPKAQYPDIWRRIETKLYHGTAMDLHDKNVWIWSDQHFWHKNIIVHANRPFATIEDMTNTLIENAQRVVKPDDVLIFLGDIGLKGRGIINGILDSIPGYKIQIIGNHDIEHNGKVINYNVDEQYLCYVYDVDNIQLWLTHYPMDNVPSNCVNVHGHIHQNTASPWNINVSVEHTNYTPINLTQVISQAKNYLQTK